VVGNDDFGALAAGEGGVGEGENPATRHQEQEQQMGPEVKRGAAQPALAPHLLHMLPTLECFYISASNPVQDPNGSVLICISWIQIRIPK